MGTVISKAANGLGGALGNVFVAPIKTIFGRSCEGVCSGTWDIICFIEHLCISSLVRLLMVMGLTYITFFFFYLLFKVGIIQCIGRSLCKMAWAACVSYWSALEGISCFLWHKLKNTKRVYHHRHHSYDIEEGDSSSSEDSDGTLEDYHRRLRVIKRSRSVRERRKSQMRRSLYPTRQRLKSGRYHHGGSHHHVRLKTAEVSVHVKGSSKGGWNSRQLQLVKKPALHRSRQLLFKKQRFR